MASAEECAVGRVALLGPAPPDRGGIAHETARLAEELGKLVAVDYLTYSRAYPAWLDPRRFSKDPRLRPAPARPVLDFLSPASWRSAADEILRGRPDALLVPWWTSFWAAPVRTIFRRIAAASPRVSRVLLCHNVQDHEGGVVRRVFASGAFAVADAFVVHSLENLRELETRFPRRPVQAIPLPTLERPPKDREGARRELGLSEGPLVLFVGLVRRYKGVDLLLDAAPRIIRETGARIAIVGEVFPDARDLAQRWASSPVRDRVIWKDEYVSEEEMGLWLAACDLVALPYRAISASAIAARALSARRPMAAAEVGGLKETVVPGSTGELFSSGDAEGLARAVQTILARGSDSYFPGLDRAARDAGWPVYARRILEFVAREDVGSRE